MGGFKRLDMSFNNKLFLILAILWGIELTPGIGAQEAIASTAEQYYDFLALQGQTKRPYLNDRTLSDSTWEIDQATGHPWQNINLGTKRELFNNFFMRLYGPELFTSFNTLYPYGQNDGALWQGRGFNTSLSGGIRFEGYGVELTFKPQLAFSQNLAFDLMRSNITNEYGYFWGTVDAPQRFGDKPFFVFDWGDTEIRYTWKTLSAGFGTQTIWLGPSYVNSILHSNNAPSYPKFDIGIRKQAITLPRLNWYIGDIEFRIWTGFLSESDYFDNDNTNDHTMFHGLSFAYAPSILQGLTFFANRVCLVPWELSNLKYIIPKKDNTIEDQKLAFGISYLLPQVGFEVYGELGVDDFVPGGFGGYVRYPFHTMVYTVGFKKTMKIMPKNDVYGELLFEWNSMEMSQDFQFQWSYSPYFHGLIIQGYTNRGQWLGAGSGWGGNSQYLEFKLYYPQGASSLFIHRHNPDNNFIYSKSVSTSASPELNRQYFTSWKSNFIVGIGTKYFLTGKCVIGGGMAYNLIVNPYYDNKESQRENEYKHNFSFNILFQYLL
jgi:hypothetical protein